MLHVCIIHGQYLYIHCMFIFILSLLYLSLFLRWNKNIQVWRVTIPLHFWTLTIKSFFFPCHVYITQIFTLKNLILYKYCQLAFIVEICASHLGLDSSFVFGTCLFFFFFFKPKITKEIPNGTHDFLVGTHKHFIIQGSLKFYTPFWWS